MAEMTRARVLVVLAIALLLTAVGAWLATRRADAPPPVRALVYGTASDYRATTSWVWRADVDGRNRVRVAEGREPDLSPDARWIAFLRFTRLPRTAYTDLYVTRSAGGDPERIRRYTAPQRLYAFEWSPDSKRLLLHESDRISVVDRDGSDYRVVFGDRPGIRVPSGASWGPSGERLVFVVDYADHSEIGTSSLEGDDGRTLTRDGAAPVWGRPGIAFHRGGARGDIWLIQSDGTGQRRLTRTAAGIVPAAWSEDGRRLLAYNAPIHNGRLWAVDVATGRAQRLTGWIGDLFPQALSRDGAMVLLAIGCGGLLSSFGVLATMPFEGGPRRTVVRGPCRGDWSA